MAYITKIHRRDGNSVINVDISNIWGDLSLQDLLGIEQEVFNAHVALGDGMYGILSAEALEHITETAGTIREQSDICMVVGSGEGFLGARAVIELLQGTDRFPKKCKGDPRIVFTDASAITRNGPVLKAELEGKDISVLSFNVPSPEDVCSPALRSLKWTLERKYGTDECSRRIHTSASMEESAMLAMAAAGIDIAAFAQGAENARKAFDLRSFENPVWLFTAVRSLMRRSGKTVELLSFWDTDCAALGKWWQHLFLDRDCGLFPVPLEFPADLPSLERGLDQDRKPFFETMTRFGSSGLPGDLSADVSGMANPEELLEQAWQDTLETHTDWGVPIITLECGAPDAQTLGWLATFLTLSSTLSYRILHPDSPTPAAEE